MFSGNWRSDPYIITGAPDDDPFGIREDDNVLDACALGDPDLSASANDGRGDDTLTGGSRQDLFVARTNETSLRAFADVITDFEEGETLQKLGVGPGGNFTGDDAFSGNDSAEVSVREEGNNRRIIADIDGDGRADAEVVLQGVQQNFAFTDGDLLL